MAAANYCGNCLTTFVGEPPQCTNLACGSSQPDGGWEQVLGSGDVLDRHYLIDRCLAVGGAGLTYKARELDADNTVIGPDLAIKVLFAARDSGAFLQRLSNEAQILQQLAHPHVVVCRGFVTRVGHPPYLVTRFERGGSLQQHIDRVGPVPPRVAAAIAHQVLTGLDRAHRAGVVHRDLKPENVLLEDTVGANQVPHIRVADFGIAKMATGVGDRLTRVGMFVGTPEYAAPEQFSGTEPSAATDIFATGGLLYFCLTGHAPVRFSQRTDLPTTYQELLDQLPPQLPDTVPATDASRAAQALLDRMMTRHASDRPSVPDVLRALAPIAGIPADEAVRPVGQTLTPSPASPRAPAQPAPALSTQPPPPETPRKTADEPAPTKGTPPPTRRRGLGPALAALGMLAVAAIVVVGVVLAGAWAMGAFSSRPGPAPAPAPVVRTAMVDLDDASTPEDRYERDSLVAILQGSVGGLHRVCGVSVDIPVRIRIGADGALTEALVNPASGLDSDRRSCVSDRLEALSVPRDATYPVQLTTVLSP